MAKEYKLDQIGYACMILVEFHHLFIRAKNPTPIKWIWCFHVAKEPSAHSNMQVAAQGNPGYDEAPWAVESKGLQGKIIGLISEYLAVSGCHSHDCLMTNVAMVQLWDLKPAGSIYIKVRGSATTIVVIEQTWIAWGKMFKAC